ncbi:MAG: N-acetyl-gamma-glutamyl-phosphate reductase, partial [Acidimicrobiales bacterium]
LAAAYPDLQLQPTDPGAADGLEVVFCALPHGVSQQIVPELRKRVGLIVDLAADFRLRDRGLYPTWYGDEHRCPELLDEAVFGLPELFGDELPGATLVASAGCYVTAAALALTPLVRGGLVEPTGVIVDAASGVSGAGAALKESNHFGSAHESISVYGMLDHRHTPEMEQAIGAEILFTPHLAPINRGILATCYARATPAGEDPLGVLEMAYGGSPFVVVSEAMPSTKATMGSNSAHLTARYDRRTGWVVSVCALDNLTKGASGQAIQCANLALGLEETAGLPLSGLWP